MTNRILRHRYQIISELGKGGFGTTYLAVDLDLPNHPQCVVKQLTPSDPRPQVFQVAKNLFDKEGKILHRLGKHDQIPQLFAYFEEGGQFYLVQEFIEGDDLAKEIYSRSRFTENQTVQLLTEILSVLKYVHEQNVIHRDLKPQNIMRRKSDGKIVLIDFGAVKEIKGLKVTSGGKTTITIVVGTPGYMPMEQVAGKPKFCSDIYAVGIMAIEALTGVHVNQFPTDDSTGEIIWKNRVNVSDDLGRVLDKMVLYDWRYRYQTIDEVMTELRGGNYSANPPTYKPTIPSGKTVNNPPTTASGSTFVLPNSWNPQQPQPKSSIDLPLVSANGFDYTELSDLLAKAKWKEANQETNIVMQKAAKVRWLVKVGFMSGLNPKSIKKIPSTDLQTIDQLWKTYSNGHFGFSVQKQIYLDTGNLPLEFRKETYKRFGEKIGWKLKQNSGLMDGWLLYRDVIFERKAPRGHLPVLRSLPAEDFWSWWLWYLFGGIVILMVFHLIWWGGSLIDLWSMELPQNFVSWGALYNKVWEGWWWCYWVGFVLLCVARVVVAMLGFVLWWRGIVCVQDFFCVGSHFLICILLQKLDEHNI